MTSERLNSRRACGILDPRELDRLVHFHPGDRDHPGECGVRKTGRVPIRSRRDLPRENHPKIGYAKMTPPALFNCRRNVLSAIMILMLKMHVRLTRHYDAVFATKSP